MYIGIPILIKSAKSTKVSLISVQQSFLNATCVDAVSGCFLWGWKPAGEPAETAIVFVTVIFPLTKIYGSEKSNLINLRLDSNELVKNLIGLSRE